MLELYAINVAKSEFREVLTLGTRSAYWPLLTPTL